MNGVYVQLNVEEGRREEREKFRRKMIKLTVLLGVKKLHAISIHVVSK